MPNYYYVFIYFKPTITLPKAETEKQTIPACGGALSFSKVKLAISKNVIVIQFELQAKYQTNVLHSKTERHYLFGRKLVKNRVSNMLTLT